MEEPLCQSPAGNRHFAALRTRTALASANHNESIPRNCAMTFLPLERLLHLVKSSPEYLTYFVLGVTGTFALLCLLFYYNRMYVKLVAKSLLRNKLRTVLSCLAVVVLVFVMTMLTSMLLFIEVVMTEKTKDLKAIVTERYQIPSQMPYAYAASLEEGAARPGHPEDVRPADSMT